MTMIHYFTNLPKNIQNVQKEFQV